MVTVLVPPCASSDNLTLVSEMRSRTGEAARTRSCGQLVGELRRSVGQSAQEVVAAGWSVGWSVVVDMLGQAHSCSTNNRCFTLLHSRVPFSFGMDSAKTKRQKLFRHDKYAARLQDITSVTTPRPNPAYNSTSLQ
jgi:hypothetical protein